MTFFVCIEIGRCNTYTLYTLKKTFKQSIEDIAPTAQKTWGRAHISPKCAFHVNIEMGISPLCDISSIHGYFFLCVSPVYAVYKPTLTHNTYTRPHTDTFSLILLNRTLWYPGSLYHGIPLRCRYWPTPSVSMATILPWVYSVIYSPSSWVTTIPHLSPMGWWDNNAHTHTHTTHARTHTHQETNDTGNSSSMQTSIKHSKNNTICKSIHSLYVKYNKYTECAVRSMTVHKPTWFNIWLAMQSIN